MMRGTYTSDFYLLPTVFIHRGDGIYTTVEFAWLKWYFGFAIIRNGDQDD